MSKTTLHNPADAEGPRGIATEKHGDILLQPGEVREDVTLTDEEHDRLKVAGLKTGKPKAAKEDDDEASGQNAPPKALEKMNRSELDAANAALKTPLTFPADASNKDRAKLIQEAREKEAAETTA